MKIQERTRKEIEDRFLQMGDYVRMDYLQRCLGSNLDYDARKFVLIKLSGLYEGMKMYLESAKMMLHAAEINTTFSGQITDYVRASELFIKGGDYAVAEVAMKRALSIANERQKEEIMKSFKEYFRTQGRFLIENDKRNRALKLYEQLFEFDLDYSERHEVGQVLLELYSKLGKIREFDRMKKRFSKE